MPREKQKRRVKRDTAKAIEAQSRVQMTTDLEVIALVVCTCTCTCTFYCVKAHPLGFTYRLVRESSYPVAGMEF